MARWEPDARGRLQAAALELYLEHGYDRTTVADIAERAGVTPRTFFRYFADRREVLFDGSERLQAAAVAAIADAPPESGPLEMVGAGLTAFGETLGVRREHSRRRQAIIDANAELQERELIKLSRLALAMGDALRRRGVPEPDASLAAEAGVAVLRVSFERWLTQDQDQDLSAVLRTSLTRLATLSAAK